MGSGANFLLVWDDVIMVIDNLEIFQFIMFFSLYYNP